MSRSCLAAPYNFIHADIHALQYFGSTLYCCSDGGVFRSSNDGANWTDLKTSVATLQFQGADYDPNNPNVISGGMQDNGKSKSSNGGLSTNQVWGGDGGYTLIDPVNTNYYYSQYVNGTVERSTDSG